jgi:Ferritin-like
MISRSDLLRRLTEACELEHGLACSYLYAAFSLRQETSEGLSSEKVRKTRQWAGQLYFVAGQEMMHLAQAWNLLTAAGGTPYYLRPNFPQRSPYYPLHQRLALEPFGARALKRFIRYEKPLDLPLTEEAADDSFRSIGELYGEIERCFAELPRSIVGNPERQVGEDLVDFPDLIRVVDLSSAKAAIERITHQGEGNKTDREDCHFGIFRGILKEYCALFPEEGSTPGPARTVVSNPVVDPSESYGARDARPITGTPAREMAALFDSLYSLMLRMLGHAFTGIGASIDRRAIAQLAIAMMVSVLRPLGEALMMTPAGVQSGSNAGPAFGLTRHVALPPDAGVALVVIHERLSELGLKAMDLASQNGAPSRLADAATRLQELKGRLPTT